jgi:hypothetical protein
VHSAVDVLNTTLQTRVLRRNALEPLQVRRGSGNGRLKLGEDVDELDHWIRLWTPFVSFWHLEKEARCLDEHAHVFPRGWSPAEILFIVLARITSCSRGANNLGLADFFGVAPSTTSALFALGVPLVAEKWAGPYCDGLLVPQDAAYVLFDGTVRETAKSAGHLATNRAELERKHGFVREGVQLLVACDHRKVVLGWSCVTGANSEEHVLDKTGTLPALLASLEPNVEVILDRGLIRVGRDFNRKPLHPPFLWKDRRRERFLVSEVRLGELFAGVRVPVENLFADISNCIDAFNDIGAFKEAQLDDVFKIIFGINNWGRNFPEQYERRLRDPCPRS